MQDRRVGHGVVDDGQHVRELEEAEEVIVEPNHQPQHAELARAGELLLADVVADCALHVVHRLAGVRQEFVVENVGDDDAAGVRERSQRLVEPVLIALTAERIHVC